MARKIDNRDALATSLAELGVIAELLDQHDAASDTEVVDWLIVQVTAHIRTARAAHAKLRSTFAAGAAVVTH